MPHATYACTGPRSGVASTCMQDPCKCSPQRSTCPGGRAALRSALRGMQLLITALYLPRRARRSGVGAPGPPCPWKSVSSSSSSTSASACSLGVLAGVIEALCFWGGQSACERRSSTRCEQGCCTRRRFGACKGGGASVAVHVPQRRCPSGCRRRRGCSRPTGRAQAGWLGYGTLSTLS